MYHKIILSVLSILTINSYGANPAIQRISHTALVARQAACQAHRITAGFARVSFCTRKPSLGECAKQLPRVLEERGRLEKRITHELNEGKRQLDANLEEVEQYRQPIIALIKRQLEDLSNEEAEIKRKIDRLIKLEVQLETEPQKVTDQLKDLIEE